ncbi:MAG TPA: carbohydrate porin [Pseudomonadales bacterium]|nr:carbohydrate porin [Pseudomonadales bacterium]
MKRAGRHFKKTAVAAAFTCVATTLSAADTATNSVAPPSVSGTNSVPPLEKSSNAQQQNWNVHAQSTFIVQGYPGFSAQYSGPNSLPSGGETRETLSLDLMAGARLWRGAEAHVDGMMWQGFGPGNALGVEGFPNGEAFRLGTSVPNGSLVRAFIRQTIGLGGPQETVPDDALDLAGTRDISRIIITAGRFSAKDIFDNNAYANDPRTQFMNWGLMANEGWDYPADAIGYTTGLTIELNQPQWTLRYGFFQMPAVQNGLTWEDKFLVWPYNNSPADGPFLKSWGMVTELERRYAIKDHPGVVRFLAYLNEADMAKYSDATAILRADGPNADWQAARAYNFKYGFGLNWEQEIAKDVGIFSRLGWNDDQEEAWVFSDVGHTASLGLSVNGDLWDRPDDTYGLAGLANGISKAAQEFFQAGGTGILAGDGNLDYGWEKVLETYYDLKIYKNLHGAVDYQFVDNPAFNRARGPVSFFAGRLHWEF